MGGGGISFSANETVLGMKTRWHPAGDMPASTQTTSMARSFTFLSRRLSAITCDVAASPITPMRYGALDGSADAGHSVKRRKLNRYPAFTWYSRRGVASAA